VYVAPEAADERVAGFGGRGDLGGEWRWGSGWPDEVGLEDSGEPGGIHFWIYNDVLWEPPRRGYT
jgi:hypothetical protein